MCSSKFKALLLALALALPIGAQAQSQTSVTGTVIGSDGIPWVGGSITATIVSAGGTSFSLTPCSSGAGCPVAPTTSPTGIAAGGTYSMSPWRNGSILPSGTTYTFTATINGLITPVGTGSQTCTVSGVTLSSASQTVNLSNCPPLTNITGFVGPVFNVLGYGAKNDGRTCTVTTNSTITITGAGSNPCKFVPADVGRIAWVVNPAPSPATLACGTTSTPQTITTQTGTTATLSAACSQTLTGTGVAYIGTDSLKGFQSACNAMIAANGGSIYAPAGIYTVGRFTATTPLCLVPSSVTGGVGFFGAGLNITTVYPAPWYQEYSLGLMLSFQNLSPVAVSGFTFDGYHIAVSGSPIAGIFTVNAFTADKIAEQNFDRGQSAEIQLADSTVGPLRTPFVESIRDSLLCPDPNKANLTVTVANGEGQLTTLDNDYICAGNVGVSDQQGDVNVLGGTIILNSPIGTINQAIATSGPSTRPVRINMSDTLICSNGLSTGGGGLFSLIDTNSAGGNVYVTLNHIAIDSPLCPAAGTNVSDVSANFSNDFIRIENSVLNAHGAGYVFTSDGGSGGFIFDTGGNIVPSVGSGFVNPGSGVQIFGSPSATGTLLAATNITPSTGWGTTGAAGNGVSAVSGDARVEGFTITAAGTPTANPTIAIVFPVTASVNSGFWQVPNCSAQQIGGTGILSDVSQSTLPTQAGVTLTWQGTPAAGSTYIFSVICQ